MWIFLFTRVVDKHLLKKGLNVCINNQTVGMLRVENWSIESSKHVPSSKFKAAQFWRDWKDINSIKMIRGSMCRLVKSSRVFKRPERRITSWITNQRLHRSIICQQTFVVSRMRNSITNCWCFVVCCSAIFSFIIHTSAWKERGKRIMRWREYLRERESGGIMEKKCGMI